MRKESRSTVLANVSYLSLLNVLNLALPLVMIPYLTLTVGAAHFGEYAYVLAVVQNMMNITAYGFNFSATRQVSMHRNNAELVNRIFNATIGAKAVIALACFALLLAAARWVFDTPALMFLFFTAMGMVLGEVMTPVWLFQGMERMKYVTITTATARIVFTALVFVAIREAEHYRYILLLDSVGYILAGVLSLWLARRQFGIAFRVPSKQAVWHQLADGFTIFCSTFFISLYRNLNIVLLKFFVPSSVVGVYAVAEKVVKAAQSVVTPVSQALFPHMADRFKQHTLRDNLTTLMRIARLLALGTAIMTLMLVLCSGYIHYVVGDDFIPARHLMYIMSPVLVFGALNYLLGFVGLVNLGHKRYFFRAVMASGIASLVVLVVLTPIMGAKGAAIAMTMSEVLLCLICQWRLEQLAREGRKKR